METASVVAEMSVNERNMDTLTGTGSNNDVQETDLNGFVSSVQSKMVKTEENRYAMGRLSVSLSAEKVNRENAEKLNQKLLVGIKEMQKTVQNYLTVVEAEIEKKYNAKIKELLKCQAKIDQKQSNDLAKLLEVMNRGPTTSGDSTQTTSDDRVNVTVQNANGQQHKTQPIVEQKEDTSKSQPDTVPKQNLFSKIENTNLSIKHTVSLKYHLTWPVSLKAGLVLMQLMTFDLSMKKMPKNVKTCKQWKNTSAQNLKHLLMTDRGQIRFRNSRISSLKVMCLNKCCPQTAFRKRDQHMFKYTTLKAPKTKVSAKPHYLLLCQNSPIKKS